MHLVTGKTGVIGARSRGGTAVQMRHDRGRQRQIVLRHHLQRILHVCSVRHGGAGGDKSGVVTGDVRDDQAHQFCRSRRQRQPPALDLRDMFAQRVHRRDRRARGQQNFVQGDFVIQTHTLRRAGQQRRAAAGDQGNHQIIRPKPRHRRQQAPGGHLPGGVGHRMRRLDDLDPRTRRPVAIAGDNHTRKRAIPCLFNRLCQLRRAFASTHHNRAAFGLCGQKPGNIRLRQGRLHGSIKQGF